MAILSQRDADINSAHSGGYQEVLVAFKFVKARLDGSGSVWRIPFLYQATHRRVLRWTSSVKREQINGNHPNRSRHTSWNEASDINLFGLSETGKTLNPR